MAGSRLDPEDAALWARVTASVRALAGRASPPPADAAAPKIDPLPPRARIAARPAAIASGRIGETLDGGWDRRLRQGQVAPERWIDLHGHTLASAHAALDHALERALLDDVRLLLVVTGRAPRPDDRQPRRGLIRAAIGDWLVASRHAGRIAGVRNAHPRHGGAGALYIVLRRRR